MGALPATIEWGKIGQLLWVSPLAGLAVAITYSLMLVGYARADEARRAGSGAVAMVYSALGLLAGIAFLAVVVFGVFVIVKK